MVTSARYKRYGDAGRKIRIKALTTKGVAQAYLNPVKFKNSFFQIYKQNSSKLKAGSEFRKLISKKTNLVENSEGPSESSKHSYQEAEREAFVEWINTALKDDKETKPYLPINPTDEKEVFEKIKDGIILW